MDQKPGFCRRRLSQLSRLRKNSGFGHDEGEDEMLTSSSSKTKQFPSLFSKSAPFHSVPLINLVSPRPSAPSETAPTSISAQRPLKREGLASQAMQRAAEKTK